MLDRICAPDIRVEGYTLTGRTLNGRAELERYEKDRSATFPDLAFKILSIHRGDVLDDNATPVVFCRFQMSGTFTGENTKLVALGGHEATGRRFNTEGLALFREDSQGTKIQEAVFRYDVSAVYLGIGVSLLNLQKARVDLGRSGAAGAAAGTTAAGAGQERNADTGMHIEVPPDHQSASQLKPSQPHATHTGTVAPPAMAGIAM